MNAFKSNVGTLETGSVGIGHVAMQYALDPILNLAPALGAYAGELAGNRFLRLCSEQNVPAILIGNASDTPQMGPQPVDILVEILQDCENADLGQMFENRSSFGLGYHTRISLQNQSVKAALDYSNNQIVLPLNPTDDDQLTRNDIVASRPNGSTYEVVQNTGPLSVDDPPNGVGLYSFAVTTNVLNDGQLPAFANWLLILGTLDEFRYPTITVDMTRAAVADGTFGAVASLDIGDFLRIVNAPFFVQSPINQLCFGFSEVLNNFLWTITINAVPEDPWSSSSGFPIW
jgi:hypothetical protein